MEVLLEGALALLVGALGGGAGWVVACVERWMERRKERERLAQEVERALDPEPNSPPWPGP